MIETAADVLIIHEFGAMSYRVPMGSVGGRLADAMLASRAGRWRETLRLCFEILDDDPRDLAAQQLLGTALHMLRDDREAAAAFKLLSVVFVDVGGSSRLTTVLGAERWRAHLLSIQSVVASAVARFEGYIHNYEGDGVLASFSFPRAHEDDARRAVLCGLAVVDDTAEISARIADECRRVGSEDRRSKEPHQRSINRPVHPSG
jgi:class 3 adenylate cyclase